MKPVYRRFPLPSGDQASWHYVEFFAANIRNLNTRRAYARALQRFFGWCDDHGLTLTTLRPFDVGEWIEQLQEKHGPAGVNQQLAGVRMMSNWLITGQVAPVNPAAVVRDPKLVRGVFTLRKGMLETIPLSGQARSALLVVRFPCLAAGRGRDFDADCAAHYTEMGRRIGAMTVEFLTEMGNEPDYIGGTAAGV